MAEISVSAIHTVSPYEQDFHGPNGLRGLKPAVNDASSGSIAERYAGKGFSGQDPAKNSTLQGAHEGASQKPADTSPLSAKNRVEKRGQGAIGELTEEEKKEVQQLKQRDTEVRRHEQAHLSAAGRYARGGANYTFTRGPDGRQYATGGEVSIDVSPARTPQATITKAQVVKAAALAPAEPSSQDRAVAAAAGKMENEARAELAKQRIEESTQQGKETNPLTPESVAKPFKQNPFTASESNSTLPRGPRQLDVRA